MQIGIPREQFEGERRVAATPRTVERLKKLGYDVLVEAGAGVGASLPDEGYRQAGATVSEDVRAVWASDIVFKVRPPMDHPEHGPELDLMVPGARLICILEPRSEPERIEALASRKLTAIAMDAIPRISRAQKMDVLSSQANIAGYRAILEASHRFGGFFGGQITAAGKTPPARVLVIGAGVAGLSAIATARGLGAEVRAFDTRSSVKDQVGSLGAKFLDLDFEEDGETASGYSKVMSQAFIDAEMAMFAEQCKEVDIVVTTALIPGRPAPKLITKAMVDSMKPGSVVVDLAAETGGNCEYTVPGTIHERNGVSIVGYTDLTSRLPRHASEFFGSNLVHLLDDMTGEDGFFIDLEDEAVRGALVTLEGEVLWPPPAPTAPPPPAAPKVAPPVHRPADIDEPPRSIGVMLGGLVGAVALLSLGLNAPGELVQHLTVFVLACFVGWQVVWNVKAALHTPLMAVTNAISGIIIVGGLLQASAGTMNLAAVLGAVAVLFAAINVFGGFMVTQRMLRMFRK